jgi:hypothetical protein
VAWGVSSLILASAGIAAAAETEEQLDARLAKSKQQSIWEKFRGSMASTSAYMGAGTFYAGESKFPGNSGPDAAFVSQDLLLYPRFTFAPRQSVRLYWVLECEYTDPDNSTGRRCDPSDTRLSYHHSKLWADPWIDGSISGSVQFWLPTGYASLNNNTIMNIRLSGAYTAYFLKEKLELSYGFSVQKYLPSGRYRDVPVTAGSIGSGDAEAGSTGSGSGMNDNWLLIHNGHVGLYFTPEWSLSVDLMVFNYFRYGVPESQLNTPGLPTAGRSDYTWGIIEGGYQPNKWFGVALGISSLQPALTAQSKLRFPFYDFIHAQDNYTKWYLTARVSY